LIEPGFAGGYHGDYDGIAADGSNFYLSWSDERNNEADAFFSQVPTVRDRTRGFQHLAVKQFDTVIAGTRLLLTASPAPERIYWKPQSERVARVNGVTYNFASSR